MNKLLQIINNKPKLYEQSPQNMWNDPYISKQMLKAHLNQDLDSATRKIDFVRKSADWIANLLPPTQYLHLLDLGCGPGIYTELFHNIGYQVTGVDLSQNSIEYASHIAKEKQLKIDYIQADYTTLEFNTTFDLITLIYCDFGVLPKDTRSQLLTNIYKSLSPNGVLLFDVFKPLKYKDVQENKSWEIKENGFWREELCLTIEALYRYDDDNTILNQYIIQTEDEITYYNIWEHTFTIEEIKAILEEAGFTNIEIYGNVAGKEYEDSDETICIIARK